MTDDEARPDGEASGADIVQKIAKEGHMQLSDAAVTVLGDAFDIDRTATIAAAAAAMSARAAAAAATSATAAEGRLDKLEQQTHALADAVIAITDPSEAVAPAVRVVKDTM